MILYTHSYTHTGFVADMVGVRAVSILLLGLPLVYQVEAQTKVFIVKGAFTYDGIFAKGVEGSKMHFKRMGRAVSGYYCYLYRGTERADSWVVGKGRSFEARKAESLAGYSLVPAFYI